jgi:hypothetical protein
MLATCLLLVAGCDGTSSPDDAGVDASVRPSEGPCALSSAGVLRCRRFTDPSLEFPDDELDEALDIALVALPTERVNLTGRIGGRLFCGVPPRTLAGDAETAARLDVAPPIATDAFAARFEWGPCAFFEDDTVADAEVSGTLIPDGECLELDLRVELSGVSRWEGVACPVP